ncbi:hypothetical protein IAU60_005625 [Kwoniella sp. DSM 27419]
MDTYISSSSPLFAYSPCKGCDPSTSFLSGAQHAGRSSDGTDSGMVTNSPGAKVAINCTGTGVAFDLTYSRRDQSLFNPKLTINGSVVNEAPSNASSPAWQDLPLGQHQVELSFEVAPGLLPSGDDWVRVNGMTCTAGYRVGQRTTNATIDDSAWREGRVLLTPGWNMLEQGQSNYIDETQYQAESATADRNWNSSISWTEQANAGNEIHFQGSAVWVYGIIGGEAGSYEVKIDNSSRGVYNSAGHGRVYGQLLYHITGLVDDRHALSLTNLEQGGRLSFDRLVAFSWLDLAPAVAAGSAASAIHSLSSILTHTQVPSSTTSSTTSSSEAPVAPSASPSTEPMNATAIAGISVATSLLVLGLIATGIWVCLRRRKEREPSDGHHPSIGGEKSDRMPRAVSRSTSVGDPSHPFHPIGMSTHPMPSPAPFLRMSSPRSSLRSFIGMGKRHSNSLPRAGPAGTDRGSPVPGGGDVDSSFLRLRDRTPVRSTRGLRGLTISKPRQIDPSQGDSFPAYEDESRNPPGESWFERPSEPSTENEVRRLAEPSSHTPMTSTAWGQQADIALPPPARPRLHDRQASLDPLHAALAGRISSPLAAISRNASYTYPAPEPTPNVQEGIAGHSPRGSRDDRESLARSSSDNRWEHESEAGTARLGSTGDGILSMYAALPGSTHTSVRPAEAAVTRQNSTDRVGLAIGTPSEGQAYPCGESDTVDRRLRIESGTMSDLPDLQPPNRRFILDADRPFSGTSTYSNKSASSAGSGWVYM